MPLSRLYSNWTIRSLFCIEAMLVMGLGTHPFSQAHTIKTTERAFHKKNLKKKLKKTFAGRLHEQ
jgi:hypothetical protein